MKPAKPETFAVKEGDMDMDITEIIEAEHRLARDSMEKCGEVFASTNQILTYFGQCFSLKNKTGHYSLLFLLQAQRALKLSTLSILRCHRVQMFHMLRDALESIVLACYALHARDQNEFGAIQDGALNIPKDLRDKVYKWFKTEYREYSDLIKWDKAMINDNFAHPNLLNAASNLGVNDNAERCYSAFFDQLQLKDVERDLWMIGDRAIGFMKIYATVIQKYRSMAIASDFPSRINELYLVSEGIKERLAKGFDPEIMKKSRERMK